MSPMGEAEDVALFPMPFQASHHELTPWAHRAKHSKSHRVRRVVIVSIRSWPSVAAWAGRDALKCAPLITGM